MRIHQDWDSAKLHPELLLSANRRSSKEGMQRDITSGGSEPDTSPSSRETTSDEAARGLNGEWHGGGRTAGKNTEAEGHKKSPPAKKKRFSARPTQNCGRENSRAAMLWHERRSQTVPPATAIHRKQM
jgi:hypothetical protein